MCGIIAVSMEHGRALLINKSLDEISHRGPDDMGVYISPQRDCHLGQVRLSILDLSIAGHQPMADSTGRYRISYNGEVYNYRDLQAELVKEHGEIAWRSGTDTEVIVEGFAREGINFLNRLNGIFALAIYDLQERLLHILRDPLGIKPLFITEQKQGVFFGSELKGLLAFPDLKRSLRYESIADQLAFMYIPEPHTPYEEYFKVEPGVCFTYREGKFVSSQPLFSHLQDALTFSSENDAIECFRTSFAHAVQRQLVADVPVSIFLSGGLDSSAIAQQAVQGGANIKDAYTISFSQTDLNHDGQSDDLYYAKIMAQRLGIDLCVIPAEKNFIALLPRLIRFMEDGFTDPAAINTYLISEGARQAGVKVMLSGQGADEYLGGYRRYLAERLLRGIPPQLRPAFAAVGNLVSKGFSGKFNATGRRLARLASLANQSPTTWLLNMCTWTTPETINELLVEPLDWTGDASLVSWFDSHKNGDIIAAMMKVDQRYDLMSLNLCYTDRMSMAVGVEARVPFLDFDLVRLMNALPMSLKIKGRQGKYILKKAMEPYLPKEVIYREKAGFGLPLRAWLRTSNEIIDHYLSAERINQQGLFKPAAIKRIVDEQMNGTTDHANTLFTLLCQQIWLESIAKDEPALCRAN